MEVRKDVANEKSAVRLKVQSVKGSNLDGTNMFIREGSSWKKYKQEVNKVSHRSIKY